MIIKLFFIDHDKFEMRTMHGGEEEEEDEVEVKGGRMEGVQILLVMRYEL